VLGTAAPGSPVSVACVTRVGAARDLVHRGASRNGSGQAPPMPRGSLALLGWPSGGSRYGSVSTDFNRKDATAPFANSGAFGLVLHWPFFGPDLYLGPYPAK
jgi:hypothetical protein